MSKSIARGKIREGISIVSATLPSFLTFTKIQRFIFCTFRGKAHYRSLLKGLIIRIKYKLNQIEYQM